MLIAKNWFYKLSEIDDKEIIIDKWIIASFYDDWSKKIDFELLENSMVDVFWYYKNEGDYTINFVQNEDNSKLKVKYLLSSKENNVLKSKIYSKISSSNSSSDVKIISLVSEKWNIDLDWIIEIDSGVKKVSANLVEENLFLWNNWKVKGIPTLLVRSDDVEASHACRIERISDDKLFYLRSRWIWKENALNLILEANIKSIFSCLSMLDDDFYNKIYWEILKEIN
jgi:Fe-S cluster assembly scaffold protein SufB